jgi:hypothetical protein
MKTAVIAAALARGLGIGVLLIAALPACAGSGHGTILGKAAKAQPYTLVRLRVEAFPQQAVSTTRLRELAKSMQAGPAVDEKRLRVGIARDVELEAALAKSAASLAWVPQPAGAQAAHLSLVSPGAASLRLALRARGLPAGAELRFVSTIDPGRVLGPVSGTEVETATLTYGSYWTPLTEGDEQQVEVWLPPGADAAAARVEIVSASHITVSPRSLAKATGAGASQSCEKDVVCVANTDPALDRAARSVAKLLYIDNGASYLCTGTLVSDGNAASQIPYLYTAAHCIGNEAAAATLNTFWFYEASSCGAKASSAYRQLTAGATLLYANASSDASLVRLNEPAPSGAWFSGWDRSALDSGSALVAVHHPAGDVKKVSLGQSMGATAGYNSVAWTSGTTEGGSSGSGLFTLKDGEYVLRGGLRGGSAACTSSGHVDDPSNRDLYSRLDQEAAQLDKWLSTASTPIRNHSGMWFAPDEPGWGLSIVQTPENRLFSTWYGYDASGKPTWLVMPQATWIDSTTVEGALYRTRGTSFDKPYDASSFAVTPVGKMHVEFAPDGSAKITASIDGVTFSKVVVPQPI